MSARPTPMIPVSWGELIDKITILEIKRERFSPGSSADNVADQHARLHAEAEAALASDTRLGELKRELATVNAMLWDIENGIRAKEAAQSFGPEFIALARAVYTNNARRAAVKKEIDRHMASEFGEEKDYSGKARP